MRVIAEHIAGFGSPAVSAFGERLPWALTSDPVSVGLRSSFLFAGARLANSRRGKDISCPTPRMAR